MYSQGLRGDALAPGSDASTFTEAFAVLQNKSRSELEKLMNDNDEFDLLVNGLAVVKKLATDKEAVMVSNASLAEYNLSLEPRLISSREDLAQHYERLVELQKQCERLMLRVESCAVNTSPDTSLALLQTELAKTEEESEKVAEEFSAAGRSADVDTFITQYVALRTSAHLRRVKVEKLTEMLNNSQRVAAAPTSAAAPPIPARPVPQPYATGPPPIASGWNSNPPYPVPGAANGWPPYPQPQAYPGAIHPYQTAPPVASYMQR